MEKKLIQKTVYYKGIVKPEIKRLKNLLANSSNSMEAFFYSERLSVQTSDFAKAMGIRESILQKYV